MLTDAPTEAAECASTSVACQLQRIADSMEGFDGDTFWATLLATVVGAVVAALIGLYVARRDKPQPFFRVDAAKPSYVWNSEGEVADSVPVEVTVSNIGDGAAYDVHLTVSKGAPNTTTQRASKLEPGETLKATMRMPASGVVIWDIKTGGYSDTRKVQWEPTLALVDWQEPPQRGKVQRRQFPVANPFADVHKR